MTWLKVALCAATLLAAGCAADPQRHDFTGSFAGVTGSPMASGTTTARP